MHAPLQALALALILLPLAPLQQRPATPGTPPARPEVTPKRTPAGDRIRENLLGAWELTEMDYDGTRFTGTACRGYFTVLPEHCTLIVRLTDPVRDQPGLIDMGFSAGTYRWSYDDSRLALEFSTLLAGTDIDDPDGIVRYEAPGARREYEVQVGERDLVLNRGQGKRRFFFRRIGKSSAPAKAATPPVQGTGEQR